MDHVCIKLSVLSTRRIASPHFILRSGHLFYSKNIVKFNAQCIIYNNRSRRLLNIICLSSFGEWAHLIFTTIHSTIWGDRNSISFAIFLLLFRLDIWAQKLALIVDFIFTTFTKFDVGSQMLQTSYKWAIRDFTVNAYTLRGMTNTKGYHDVKIAFTANHRPTYRRVWEKGNR